jgi:hypothetical protein
MNESPLGRRQVLAIHKFAVGQTVYLRSLRQNRATPAGTYRITRLLPEAQGDHQYRIKSVRDAHERVARESELDRKQSAFN